MTTVLDELGRTVNRAWAGLVAGWRELMRGAGTALTKYTPLNDPAIKADQAWPTAVPTWGLLPGEIMDTGKSVVVLIELPGVARDDIEVFFEGNTLCVRGEKRADREYIAASYYLRERAYGAFERVVPLPANVDTERAKASYRSGVLTVELPKTAPSNRRRLAVQ